MKTEADRCAAANGWSNAQACGYLDGKRDAERGARPYCGRFEMTDYAHGYWRGYGGSGNRDQGEIKWTKYPASVF